MSDQGEQANDATKGGQDAAGKALNAAKNRAKDAKDVGKLVASGGTDVTSWISLAKRWLPPIIGFFMVLNLIIAGLIVAMIMTIFSVLFSYEQENASAACASGATDIAVLATNGPVNAGDKVTDPVYGGTWTFKPEYMANAQAIVRAGLNYKNQSTGTAQPIPAAGIVIAIATAFVESHLYNNPGGDRDSVGLFQQRDSWGSNADRMNPTISATLFYNRLVALKPPWHTMDPGAAAQKVQVSAHPERYGKAMSLAAGITLSILDAINKENATTQVSFEQPQTNQPVVALASPLRIQSQLNRPLADSGPAAPATSPPATGDTTADPEDSFDCALEPVAGEPVTPSGYEPGPNGAQIPITTVPGIGKINATIASQVKAMLAKAESEGVKLTGGSYRSHASQIQLRIAHCGSSQYAIYEMPSRNCSPPTARPGRSQHEYGLAIDFNNCSSRSTKCYQWLAANAATYGLKNLPSEPWHWSTTGN